MQPKLLLVLQTHSLGDSQRPDGTRFCGANKSEVMRRCTRSLVESVNYAQNLLVDFEFELVVLDDHSDEKSLEKLKANLNIATFPTKLIHLETYGIMPSILQCYEYGKMYGTDWVYFVQDDYLYEETAIFDMLMVAMETSQKLQNYTCVFPYNDPYRYEPVNTAVQSHIIRSQGRHWRTQLMTASCFLVHHHVILKHWHLFYNMGTHEITHDMEDVTINQLFRSLGYYLFVPIPSLALHMQYESEMDPFIDWRKLWDKYERHTVIDEKIDFSKKNLLDVGFGGKKLNERGYPYAEDLKGFEIVSMDIDKSLNPDIVCDLLDMSLIPDNSFDRLYCCHALEHIDYFHAPKVLKEFQRILKSDGMARIVVPNIKMVGMYILQDRLEDTIYESQAGPVNSLDILYGHKYSIRKKNNEFMRHKTGYSVNRIKEIANTNNLKISVEESGIDLLINLYK